MKSINTFDTTAVLWNAHLMKYIFTAISAIGNIIHDAQAWSSSLRLNSLISMNFFFNSLYCSFLKWNFHTLLACSLNFSSLVLKHRHIAINNAIEVSIGRVAPPLAGRALAWRLTFLFFSCDLIVKFFQVNTLSRAIKHRLASPSHGLFIIKTSKQELGLRTVVIWQFIVLKLVFSIRFVELFYSYSSHAIKPWFLKLERWNYLRLIFLFCLRCFLRLILTLFLNCHEVSKIVVRLVIVPIKVPCRVEMLDYFNFQGIFTILLTWTHSIVMKQSELVWVSPVWHAQNRLILRVHVHGILLEIPSCHVEC